MALHDIEHYEDALSEVARVLKENGRFIFSIPHPCFEQIVKDTKGWRNVSGRRYYEGRKNMNGKDLSQSEIRSYFEAVKYEIFWTMQRISKPFETVSFHRTLTDYFQALHKNGFLVSRLVEPRPRLKAVSKHPPLRKVLDIPQSIIIEAVKWKKS